MTLDEAIAQLEERASVELALAKVRHELPEETFSTRDVEMVKLGFALCVAAAARGAG